MKTHISVIIPTKKWVMFNSWKLRYSFGIENRRRICKSFTGGELR